MIRHLGTNGEMQRVSIDGGQEQLITLEQLEEYRAAGDLEVRAPKLTFEQRFQAIERALGVAPADPVVTLEVDSGKIEALELRLTALEEKLDDLLAKLGELDEPSKEEAKETEPKEEKKGK